MDFVIQPIVEGDGEVHAIRDLIRRIAFEFWNEASYVQVLRPILWSRGKIIKNPEDAVKQAEKNLRFSQKIGGILVLFDSDDDCPATLAPTILERAKRVCGYIPISVVMAHREYEAWFLASAPSIEVLNKVDAHENPESKRDAKGWLAEKMGSKYEERIHQPAFTNEFDLQMARAAAPSFDKLCRDLITMLTALSNIPQPP